MYNSDMNFFTQFDLSRPIVTDVDRCHFRFVFKGKKTANNKKPRNDWVTGSSVRWRKERDSNPRCPIGHAAFPGRYIQPLCHPSAVSDLLRFQIFVFSESEKAHYADSFRIMQGQTDNLFFMRVCRLRIVFQIVTQVVSLSQTIPIGAILLSLLPLTAKQFSSLYRMRQVSSWRFLRLTVDADTKVCFLDGCFFRSC